MSLKESLALSVAATLQWFLGRSPWLSEERRSLRRFRQHANPKYWVFWRDDPSGVIIAVVVVAIIATAIYFR